MIFLGPELDTGRDTAGKAFSGFGAATAGPFGWIAAWASANAAWLGPVERKKSAKSRVLSLFALASRATFEWEWEVVGLDVVLAGVNAVSGAVGEGRAGSVGFAMLIGLAANPLNPFSDALEWLVQGRWLSSGPVLRMNSAISAVLVRLWVFHLGESGA